MKEEECYGKLNEMYDGYHFCEDSEGMYNPFSLLNTFASRKFNEYWFETGTPTFLVRMLKQTDYDITQLPENEVEGDTDMLSGIYRLGFPNKEVKKGFITLCQGFFCRQTQNIQYRSELFQGDQKD